MTTNKLDMRKLLENLEELGEASDETQLYDTVASYFLEQYAGDINHAILADFLRELADDVTTTLIDSGHLGSDSGEAWDDDDDDDGAY